VSTFRQQVRTSAAKSIDRCRPAHFVALPCQREQVVDHRRHPLVGRRRRVEVLALPLFPGEFDPTGGDVQRVPEVVGDHAGERLQPLVLPPDVPLFAPDEEVLGRHHPGDDRTDGHAVQQRVARLGGYIAVQRLNDDDPADQRRETERPEYLSEGDRGDVRLGVSAAPELVAVSDDRHSTEHR
jgi:hypothetical protein